MSYCYIFHEIALVEDIASCDGNFDIEKIFVGWGGSCKNAHTLEKAGEILGRRSRPVQALRYDTSAVIERGVTFGQRRVQPLCSE